jgi:hypothetical protein
MVNPTRGSAFKFACHVCRDSRMEHARLERKRPAEDVYIPDEWALIPFNPSVIPDEERALVSIVQGSLGMATRTTTSSRPSALSRRKARDQRTSAGTALAAWSSARLDDRVKLMELLKTILSLPRASG